MLKTKEEIKASRTRNHIFRHYDDVYTLLRRIFNIPEDEMVLNFFWDKNENELVLETLKDKEKT